MKRTPILERLRELPPFRCCTERELRRIDGLTCFREVPAGTVLCRYGSVGRETFVIVSGEAAVTIDGTQIAILSRGAFVDEMAVLDGDRRTAKVTALTPMEVLVFSPGELETMLADVPHVARRMLAAMSTRLRLANPAPMEPAEQVDGARHDIPNQLLGVGEPRK